MRIVRAAVVIAGCLGLGCSGGGDDPRGLCGSGDVLLNGRVVRITEDHAFNGSVEFGADSVAHIELFSNPALGGDGESTLIAQQTLSPAPPAPFDFCITGSLEAVADSKLDYHVSALIKQHRGEDTVGDLLSETLHRVTPPARDVDIEVSGLESCDAPNAGGFCLQQ